MPSHSSSMPSNISSNVINFPSFGKPITLDDQGVYYAMNTRTQTIHSIFQLDYQGDDWYLFQLESTDNEDETRWSLLIGNVDYVLHSMASAQIKQHFSKPEYAEPRGAWQVIKNSKFGFGKFTPIQAAEPVLYAMLAFVDGEMLTPILIHKIEESAESEQVATLDTAEFA
ncbi:MAG: hypothetical protein PSV17_02835 [Methylotenera sp.]|uniref:hypothetical protein n=1 Tax=Methylotenera sp. TaxID=2051956 RepID=UPI002488D4CD|nr:hypothetical protein [Methylotenera sp.]MDI1308356.1 hypothetical protein [Methylotenera sp.]